MAVGGLTAFGDVAGAKTRQLSTAPSTVAAKMGSRIENNRIPLRFVLDCFHVEASSGEYQNPIGGFHIGYRLRLFINLNFSSSCSL